ncbi:MAG: TatD DNase family protein [Oleispira sp.]|jgi:TatD DNase family protein
MPFFDKISKSEGPYQGPLWIDSHCHFDFKVFDEERDSHWQFLQRWGCLGLLIPGVMEKDWQRLISLCDGKPWVYALGLHPYFLDQHKATDVSELALVCQANKPVAIGEFGLDFALPETTFPEQIELCQQQFKLAQKLELPVILHVRKAYDDITAMVRRLGFNQGGIIHAFSGSAQQGNALIKLGFKLGIGGAISHERAKKLRKTVCQLPLSSIVLETDSPDMKPAFLAGLHNSPISLVFLAQIVASVKQCALNDVIFASNNNLLALMPSLKYRI